MPISVEAALDDQSSSAQSKALMLRRTPTCYLMSSMLAGAYIGIAVVLVVMVSALFVTGKSPGVKLIQGSVFGIALTLVVFAGAELWTGNAMVMVQGLARGKASLADVIRVWIGSMVGNLIGSVGLSILVNASGIMTLGGKKGEPSPYLVTLAGIVKGKVALSASQLFFRAILCNMLVCLAVWMAARAEGDAAKLICLWWGLLAFIASGFEHSVANMTVFSLAVFSHVGTWDEMWSNLAFTIPGNLVGGALLVGAAYGWLGHRDHEPTETTSHSVPVRSDLAARVFESEVPYHPREAVPIDA